MCHSSTEQINKSLYFIGLGKKGLKAKGISGAKTSHQRWHACFTNEILPAPKVKILNSDLVDLYLISWRIYFCDLRKKAIIYGPVGSYSSYRLLKLFSVLHSFNGILYGVSAWMMSLTSRWVSRSLPRRLSVWRSTPRTLGQ